MKNIIILLFLSLFLLQCTKDEPDTVSTMNVNGKEYKMPVISKDTLKVKESFLFFTPNVYVVKEGAKIVITTDMTEAQSSLFSSFRYELTMDGESFDGLTFSYKYRNVNTLSDDLRRKVTEYFERSVSIQL